MGDAVYNGIPEWLLDTFGDPIWRHDQCPWRRHSYPVTAPDEFSDDSTNEFLRPDYPHSEPDRDLPEWSSPRHISPQEPEHIHSCLGSTEAMAIDWNTIMKCLADPYWAIRGWVLYLIICWKETNANQFCRRRSDNSRRRSSKQTPPNSHLHSARRNSSSNWYVVDPRTAGGCADKTAGSAVFTARRLRGHGTSFRPRNTIRKASSLFRSQ